MKNSLLIVVFLIVVSKLNAQYFNNINNELSYQLIEKFDDLGKYRIYIVTDDLAAVDNKALQEWDNLNEKIKISKNK